MFLKEDRMNDFLSEQSADIIKSIIDFNTDAIFIISVEGIILDANRGVTRIFGHTKENVIGRVYNDTVQPEMLEYVKERFKEALQGIPCEFKMSSFHANGDRIHLLVKYIPLYTDGQVVGLFVVAVDITEQQRMEKALVESEERYRKLVEMLPVGIAVLKNGEILYANPYALNFAGKEDVLGDSIFEYVHPFDQETAKKILLEERDGHGPSYMELRLRRLGGETIYLDMGAVSITQDNSPVTMAMFKNITEQKLAIDALKESEERYRLLAENSQDMLQLVDLDGIVTFASPSHRSVLGYEPQEYVGKWVFHRPDAEENDEEFQMIFFDMVVSQKPFTYEIHRRHKAGHEVWIELKGTPMFDEDGHFRNMMLVGREITERKNYQKQLEQLSYYDALTGVLNRRMLSLKFDQFMKDPGCCPGRLAVMMMDVDKFKHINDTFGHDVGDEFLRQFVRRVQQCIGENDVLTRFGGDEFVVVLPEAVDEHRVTDTADQILQSLRHPWDIGGHQFITTSSIGIAFREQEDQEKELLQKADIALYQAKSAGKDTWRIFNKE